MEREPAFRRRWMVCIGVVLISAFLILRFLNFYGDPQPWKHQANFTLTTLSFLRTAKYPPSLDYLLMTLGPAFLIWALLDRWSLKANNPLLVFGRVPLFYFLGHFFLIQAITYIFAWVRYGTVGFLRNTTPTLGGDLSLYPAGYGYNLPQVYLIWIAVVALMYYPCLYLARLKNSRGYWWFAYL